MLRLMASNENGRLRIVFVPVLLIDGLVQINFILCVCVLPFGKPAINNAIWNLMDMLMFCCCSFFL